VSERILITGAAGKIGTLLRRSLRREDRFLRLVDIAEQTPLDAGESGELVTASITDQAAMDRASDGMDAVVHLGGLASGGFTWDEYLDVNINGTRVVFEAARRAGVTRVVFASSNHAVGFHPITAGEIVPDYLFARPDSFYGVSKAAGEALGTLYHDRYGIDVVCLRIGSYLLEPEATRNRWSWLSPGDCVRLFDAAISAASPGFRVVWGVSANRDGILSLKEGFAIGYRPQDDAANFGELSDGPGDAARWRFVGGSFTAPGFDRDGP
jgi:nucleoside-diphosphate-sugar epimerase